MIVLVQFYLLFPLLAWVLDRAARWHVAIAGVGLAAQLAVTIALHYLHMNSLIWRDIDATREITSYGFYLVAGAVTGAHLRPSGPGCGGTGGPWAVPRSR